MNSFVSASPTYPEKREWTPSKQDQKLIRQSPPLAALAFVKHALSGKVSQLGVHLLCLSLKAHRQTNSWQADVHMSLSANACRCVLQLLLSNLV
jgi:hypothetical protein